MYRETGNALFLILIAVALFAALSYALTQSGRGTGTIAKEQALLDAAVAQQCLAAVEHGELRLKFLNGCSEDAISYELADGTNENPSNPSDTACFVFHIDGGGVTPCGTYLEANAVTQGDTSTVFPFSGTSYRCYEWVGSACRLSFSADGNPFKDVGGVCVQKQDVNPPASTFDPPWLDGLCNAACGGSSAGRYTNFSFNATYFLNADFTFDPDPFTDTCQGMLTRGLLCDCW